MGSYLDWKGGSHSYDQHGGTDDGAPTGTRTYPAYRSKVINVVSNYVGKTYPGGPIESGNRVVIDTLNYTPDGHRYVLRYSHLATGWVYVSYNDIQDNDNYSICPYQEGNLTEVP